MSDVFWIFSLVFSLEILLINITDAGKRFPRIPGDIYLDKIGIYVKIPFVSAIVFTVILTYLFNLFEL